MFRGIFFFGGIRGRGSGGRKKFFKFAGIFCDVALRYVGVDFAHGLVIGPAAELHDDFFGDAQVIGEGDEAVAEAVDAHLGEAVLFADAVDLCPDGVGVARHHKAGLLLRGGEGGVELVHQNGDGAGGAFVLVLLLLLQDVVLIEDGGAADADGALFKVDVLPLEGHDLGAAEAVEGQKSGNLRGGAVDGGDEGTDLLRLQEGPLVGDDLGELDLRHGDAGIGQHGNKKAPGVFQGLGGALLRLQADGPLPFVRGDIGKGDVHQGLEPGAADRLVAPDSGGGEDGGAVGDVLVHGLPQGGELRDFLGRGGAPAGEVLRLDVLGLADALAFRGGRDGDALTAQAELDEVIAGGHPPGLGDFHGGLLSGWSGAVSGRCGYGFNGVALSTSLPIS